MRGSKVARRKIGSVDLDTGEVLDGVVVICGLKRNPYSGGWVMNAQEALEILAVDRDLKGETYRVLLFLLSRLDFENWIQVPQVEIAEKLQMHKQDVNKAMKLLESKGIILKGPKAGRSYAFRLNPHYGWKGKVKNLDEYRRKQVEEEIKDFAKRHRTNSLKVIPNQIPEEISSNTCEIKVQDSNEKEDTLPAIEVARREILRSNANESTKQFVLTLLEQMDKILKTQVES